MTCCHTIVKHHPIKLKLAIKTFLYNFFIPGYNNMTAAWQRNSATTSINLEIYNNDSNKMKINK